jgi:hypothetical protein
MKVLMPVKKRIPAIFSYVGDENGRDRDRLVDRGLKEKPICVENASTYAMSMRLDSI